MKQNAVPSIFDFPAHLKKQPLKEWNSKNRVSQAPHPHSLSEHSAPKKPKFDHMYVSNASTTKLKSEFTKRLKKKNLIISNLRHKNWRREKTIKGLMIIIENSKLVSKESCMALINNFGPLTSQLIKNEYRNNKECSGSWYATKIKEFAISLHFYSPKAYMFLRKYLSLPHPSTIHAWSAGMKCEPGLPKKPLPYIADLGKDGQMDFTLINDEMGIKKETKWDPKHQNFVGTVDYGNIKAEDPDNIATNAFVIMIGSFKKPLSIPLLFNSQAK